MTQMTQDAEKLLENKTVLVTGGIGSIGSEIVRQLLSKKVKQIRVYDNRETEAYEMQNRLSDYSNVRILIGDLRDKERLDRAMSGVDIIFHCGALKHVHLCEYNPFEAVKTNVIGTQNIIDIAIKRNIERLLFISTDKAVNPSSTLGATKLLAERLVLNAEFHKGNARTIFSSVRFGNVLRSRGSVINLFEKQIAGGGPVTITDENMTRFIMSIEQAVKLVFRSFSLMAGGEIFILKMPVVKIKDFAQAMINELAKKYGKKPEDIEIKTIGVRPGEKFKEELMTGEEMRFALETEELFIIPQYFKYSRHHELQDYSYHNTRKISGSVCSSTTLPLTVSQIEELIRKETPNNEFSNASLVE